MEPLKIKVVMLVGVHPGLERCENVLIKVKEDRCSFLIGTSKCALFGKDLMSDNGALKCQDCKQASLLAMKEAIQEEHKVELEQGKSKIVGKIDKIK